MAVGSSMLATIRTGAAAVGAGGDVDGKDPLEPLRPAHRTALLLGLRGSSWALTSTGAASPAGRLPRPEGVSCARRFAFGANTPWKAGEMRARWRDQCRQLGDEVHRIPFDMRGPISPRRLELIPHPTLR